MKTASDELREAWEKLVDAIAKSLGLFKMVHWLADKMNKRGWS